MENVLTISSKFKNIRNTYKLTLRDLAALLPTISKTALIYWENGKRIPNLDNLAVYACTFGLSIDWLAGISPDPYTIYSIEYAENAYFSTQAKHRTVRDSVRYFDAHEEEFRQIQNNYIYQNDRQNHYSLAARANVLVLLQLLDHLSQPDSSNNRDLVWHNQLLTLISKGSAGNKEIDPIIDIVKE